MNLGAMHEALINVYHRFDIHKYHHCAGRTLLPLPVLGERAGERGLA
jgi:hypothetical protein